jgi:hypothetical protein
MYRLVFEHMPAVKAILMKDVSMANKGNHRAGATSCCSHAGGAAADAVNGADAGQMESQRQVGGVTDSSRGLLHAVYPQHTRLMSRVPDRSAGATCLAKLAVIHAKNQEAFISAFIYAPAMPHRSCWTPRPAWVRWWMRGLMMQSHAGTPRRL